ncbi:hypothetical protein [uncultured Litoreibacter sp.]|uniref:hypothetical protein n=1 Tax=uncultured Litoreibacter sp. TaxID=1392394 RepID=UPI00261B28D5|nr:hypothetical protein [uncultured Litoreibacter sp.]
MAALFLASCNEVSTSQSGPDSGTERKASRMMSLVAKSAIISPAPLACPLSIYRSKSNQDGEVANCKTHPKLCIAQCEQGNRKSCFDAAQVIEAARARDGNQATYPLYVEGCALGDSNACVNAIATLKNTVWSSPPPAKAVAPACQYKTVKRMCDEKAPWGCYMTAKEYQRHGKNGYVKNSKVKHDRYMRRACALAPKSGACLDPYK